MDAYMLWLGNSIAHHVSTHLRPALPDGLWPLVHELTIIIVRGGPTDAESQAAATLAVPDQDDTDLLTEYATELLDQLQDQLASLIHTGWPGDGGLLHPTAEVRDSQLLLGYLSEGATWDNATDRDVVLPPFPLPAGGPRIVLAG
jgi:hypothetical protein